MELQENPIETTETEVEEKPAENETKSSKIGEFFGKFAVVQKFKVWTERKPQLWQLIKFTVVSMLAGLTEIVSTAILAASLKNVTEPVHWFIFNYPTIDGGLGMLITVLVATTLAQIVAFIINRKKTFKSNSNIIFSTISYAVMVVVLLIGLRMYTTPLMISGINAGINNLGLSLALVTAIWMALSFAITFVCSKYIIMREPKKKKEQTS
jgi:putative flippase GtrA